MAILKQWSTQMEARYLVNDIKRIFYEISMKQ